VLLRLFPVLRSLLWGLCPAPHGPLLHAPACLAGLLPLSSSPPATAALVECLARFVLFLDLFVVPFLFSIRILHPTKTKKCYTEMKYKIVLIERGALQEPPYPAIAANRGQ
jgi:hypothetical protein